MLEIGSGRRGYIPAKPLVLGQRGRETDRYANTAKDSTPGKIRSIAQPLSGSAYLNGVAPAGQAT